MGGWYVPIHSEYTYGDYRVGAFASLGRFIAHLSRDGISLPLVTVDHRCRVNVHEIMQMNVVKWV